ncbi:hypothetical protein V1292_002494 [Bradyrhizobium sp. AZCC 1719]|uniref:DUF6650 family protein n=1 Tax=Bradyrhizobium sp. AZCC 1719 TaxID=3117028 RepID=UPI002FF10027
MTTSEKVRIKGQELLSRLSSLSLLGFGIGVKFPEAERGVVREIIIFLEDRRVLYVNFNLEVESQVIDSVLSMRKELTSALKRVDSDSPAAKAFNSMRAECRRFLTSPRAGFPNIAGDGPRGRGGMDASFFESLGKLRTVFGLQLAGLAALYDLDLSPELETILPPPPDTDEEDDLERRHWRY